MREAFCYLTHIDSGGFKMFKTRSDMEIILWARKIMDEHGLGHWSFKINGRFKHTIGMCSHTRKLIQLRRSHVQEDTYECVLDTLLHEIAHAIVGYDHAHDIVWKRKAIELGAKPIPSKKCIKEASLIEQKGDDVYAFFLPTMQGEIFQCVIQETLYNDIQSGKKNAKTFHITRRKAATKGRLVARKLTAKQYAEVVGQ